MSDPTSAAENEIIRLIAENERLRAENEELKKAAENAARTAQEFAKKYLDLASYSQKIIS